MTDKFANFKEMGKFLTAQTIEQEEGSWGKDR